MSKLQYVSCKNSVMFYKYLNLYWAGKSTKQLQLIIINNSNAQSVFEQPFVKRFALCYQAVVCPVCDIGVLWLNGWTDPDETCHAGFLAWSNWNYMSGSQCVDTTFSKLFHLGSIGNKLTIMFHQKGRVVSVISMARH